MDPTEEGATPRGIEPLYFKSMLKLCPDSWLDDGKVISCSERVFGLYR